MTVNVSVHQTLEHLTRASWGKLVAFLAVRNNDLCSVEDALAASFATALEVWPRKGIPENPEAWVMLTARRKLIDATRRAQTRTDALPELAQAIDDAVDEVADVDFPDERLKLLFVCAHPAIQDSVRTPLMLQTILGLDAARIASAFLVSPASMSQRLVRAKTKIRDAGIPFQIPGPRDLPERMESVLQAIYAAYGTGWEGIASPESRHASLAEEAVWLAKMLVELMPREGEAHALLALMLYCESRRNARRGPEGNRFVPLDEQDVSLWSAPMIQEAEHHLLEAAKLGVPGHFQLQAAIQSVHAARAKTGRTEWRMIAAFYHQLCLQEPTVGLLVGNAVAVAHTSSFALGIQLLQDIAGEETQTYQPYWATLGYLQAKTGDLEKAAKAFQIALGLTEDPQLREYLALQMRRCLPAGS